MDLNSRNAKWKREQNKIKERARRQQETESLHRAAAEKARKEMESAQAQKRIERAIQQAEAAQLALDEQRQTGGIKYVHQLQPVPMTTDGDKITLPVTALEELNPQNAFDLGVFTFELSYADEMGTIHKTHGGVLEFTADEGTVGIPPKVAVSLFSSDGSFVVPPMVQIRFVRLEKGKFACLQPMGDGFGSREIDFKKILERSLKAHTTLTVGDVLFVRHGRETFEVKVTDLQPEEAVNILNTDLEVTLVPSESAMFAEELAKRKQDEEIRIMERERIQAELKLEKHRERERAKKLKMDALESEPAADEGSQVRIVLRMPSGTQSSRRFRHDTTLSSVFAFVEAQTGETRELFRLVAMHPRRVFVADMVEKSLKELGLNGRQESLFVEQIEAVVDSSDDRVMEQRGIELNGSTTTTISRPLILHASWQVAKEALEKSMDEVRTYFAGSCTNKLIFRLWFLATGTICKYIYTDTCG